MLSSDMSKDQRVIDAEFEVISGPLEAPAPLPFKQRLQAELGVFKYLGWGLWLFGLGGAILGEVILPALSR